VVAEMGDTREGRRALDDLFSATYEQLKKLAATVKGDFSRSTINPTAIVDEAWVKLAKSPQFAALPENEFRSLAAHAMRQVLVEAARHQSAQKRGGMMVRVTFDFDADAGSASDAQQILDLDDAIQRLAEVDPLQAEIAVHRIFLGRTDAEIAHIVGKSASTVARSWRVASAWLRKLVRAGS
jgi:RNA polymerase sigma factor (TIGR02999 family)